MAFFELLAHLPTGRMLDMGAAVGHYTKVMRRFSPSSPVTAFEPFPGNIPRFIKNVGPDPEAQRSRFCAALPSCSQTRGSGVSYPTLFACTRVSCLFSNRPPRALGSLKPALPHWLSSALKALPSPNVRLLSQSSPLIADAPTQKRLEHLMRLPVVYTMGKVASSSVTQAIVRASVRCHDIHTLDPQHLLKMARARLDRGEYPPFHVCVSMAWEAEIRDTNGCVYISLVRDPIARNISAYFQNFPISAERAEMPLKVAEEVVAAFRERYPHPYPARWFDNEFRRFLGIDIYSVPFDRIRRNVATEQFLLMRTDLNDAEKSRLLSKAIGSRIHVERQNVGEWKGYSQIYQSVLEIAKFPAAFVDAMYATPFARHFWTDDELAALRDRWTEASGKTFVSVDQAVPDRLKDRRPLPSAAVRS